MAHYVTVAHEGLHPLSRGALDVVARSKQGTYFLLAPLLAKARSGVVGLGLMVGDAAHGCEPVLICAEQDLYATMTTVSVARQLAIKSLILDAVLSVPISQPARSASALALHFLLGTSI
jgi:hypothetical protein